MYFKYRTTCGACHELSQAQIECGPCLPEGVSAWDTSLNCVYLSSAILGEQEGQSQEEQREISV